MEKSDRINQAIPQSCSVPKSSYEVRDNKIYDVSKSTFILDFKEGWYSLYKTRNNHYFVTTNKVKEPLFEWFCRSDFFEGYRHDINPLPKYKVMELLNKLKRFDILQREFPELEEA